MPTQFFFANAVHAQYESAMPGEINVLVDVYVGKAAPDDEGVGVFYQLTTTFAVPGLCRVYSDGQPHSNDDVAFYGNLQSLVLSIAANPAAAVTSSFDGPFPSWPLADTITAGFAAIDQSQWDQLSTIEKMHYLHRDISPDMCKKFVATRQHA